MQKQFTTTFKTISVTSLCHRFHCDCILENSYKCSPYHCNYTSHFFIKCKLLETAVVLPNLTLFRNKILSQSTPWQLLSILSGDFSLFQQKTLSACHESFGKAVNWQPPKQLKTVKIGLQDLLSMPHITCVQLVHSL